MCECEFELVNKIDLNNLIESSQIGKYVGQYLDGCMAETDYIDWL